MHLEHRFDEAQQQRTADGLKLAPRECHVEARLVHQERHLHLDRRHGAQADLRLLCGIAQSPPPETVERQAVLLRKKKVLERGWCV